MWKYNFYTTNEIKPKGWLLKQLNLQADGLNGNLDKIWPSVRDSSWIGGDDDGWERVPYWLDGFVVLAYLLEDEDKIARAKKYIDAIIANQKESGWICPCDESEIETYDTWAVLLISKVLTVYYDCSKDQRIPDVLYRAMKNYYELLRDGKIHLFGWAEYRWFEGFVAINFLLEHYREDWIYSLAELLKNQGFDYSQNTEKWERYLNKWTFETHVVNLAMMLKYEALSCDALKEDYTDVAQKMLDKLFAYNGTPVGIFTGDECLAGISPIHGTELCAVAEIMYSYEYLYARTGDTRWLELLERVTFNALPATISDDMWTHQYVQFSNQIALKKFPGKPIFGTNGNEAHLFGLEPNYGCCTANFGQAWPKFAASLYMHNEDVIVNTVPVPSQLKTEDVTVSLESNYPFENKLRYTVQSKRSFIFKVCLLPFAENILVNGEKYGEKELEFKIEKDSYKEIEIEFTTKPHFAERPNDLTVVECGSLVFSIPVKYKKEMHEFTKDGVERKFPYCDYEYLTDSQWQYGYCGNLSEPVFCGTADVPFSSENPPVTIDADVTVINWGFEDGYEDVCAKLPAERKSLGEKQTVTLVPYGCAKLRMTEVPVVSE